MPNLVKYRNCAGLSTTSGTSNFVISGAHGQYTPIIGTVTDGDTVCYKAVYADGTDGYEVGRGVYNSGTNTLTRSTDIYSSSGSGVKESFSGSTLLIMVSADPEALYDMASRAGGDRFGAVKPTSSTPILLFSFGQSNPLGLHTAANPHAHNSKVKVFGSLDPYTGTQPGKALNSSNFGWVSTDSALAKVTDIDFFAPYYGYLRGSTGNQAIACANRLQERTGREVYVVIVAQGGIPIQYYQGGSPTGSHRLALDAVIPYVMGLAELSGITEPDLVLWGQSEGNFSEIAFAANYKTPLEYKDIWITDVYEYGLTQGWFGPNTRVYLTEPTQFANWTGTPSGTGIAAEYPLRWEGINAVARYTSEKVTMVSSVGIPWETTTPSPTPLGFALYIHFTGDGNNEYGERIADVELGLWEDSSLPSVELAREKYPTLGGNLDAAGYNITDAGAVTVDSLTNTTGVITSTVADGSSPAQVGHTLVTPSYTTAGSKLLSIKNNTTEKAYIDKDGALVCNNLYSNFAGSGITLISDSLTVTNTLGTGGGDFSSAVSNGASAIAYNFDTVNSLSTTGAKIAAFVNQGTEKLAVTKDGYLTGKAPGSGDGVVAIQPSDDATSVRFTFSQFAGLATMTCSATAQFTISTSKADSAGNVFAINNTTALTGTSTGKNLMVLANNSANKVTFNHLGAPGFWGATPVATQATAGVGGTSGFTAVGGTTAQANSTWTGGSGTAYTVHDIVKALKDVGILTA